MSLQKRIRTSIDLGTLGRYTDDEIEFLNKDYANIEECRRTAKWKYQNIPKRYYVTFLVFLSGIMEGYVISNMSTVMVEITSDKKIIRGNETEIIKAEYNWTSVEKGLILSMNFIGQVLGCLSGVAVHKFGGAVFLGIGKLGEAFISLTTPFMMSIGVYVFAGHRFVLGLFEGLSLAAAPDVIVHWAPPNERVRLSTLVYLGLSVGIVFNYPVSGFIIQNFSWQTLFYISGAVILIWSIIWIGTVGNDPSTDKFITQKERSFLSREINYLSKGKVEIPYRSIFTCAPVYALLNEFFIFGLITSFMTLIPLYVKDKHDTDIQTIGLISGIPEFGALLIRPFFAHLIDNLRSKPNGYGINKLHKIMLFWGQLFTLVFFFITSFWNNFVGCIICLTLARMSFSVSAICYGVLAIDIGGQYAGFLQSVAHQAKSAALFINPILMGLLIQNHSSSEWNVYFLVISFFTMFGVVVFLIFGSGDLQPWATVSPKKVTDNNHDHQHTTRRFSRDREIPYSEL